MHNNCQSTLCGILSLLQIYLLWNVLGGIIRGSELEACGSFFLHHHFHFNWPQSSWTQEFPDKTEKRHCCHVTLKHGRSSLQKLDESFAERISFSVTWAHGQTGCCFLYCVKTQSKHSFTLESQHKLWTRSTENAELRGRLSKKSIDKIETLVFIVLTAKHCGASWFAMLRQKLKVPYERWPTCTAGGGMKGQSRVVDDISTFEETLSFTFKGPTSYPFSDLYFSTQTPVEQSHTINYPK